MSPDYPGARFPKVTRVTAEEARSLLAGESAKKRGRFGIRTAENKAARQVDGHTFDSGLEVTRYGDLRTRQRAGEISGIEVHPSVTLLVNGVPIKYRPDFAYTERGVRVWEECKGGATQGGRWPTIMKLWLAVGPGPLHVLVGTKRGYRRVKTITPRGAT